MATVGYVEPAPVQIAQNEQPSGGRRLFFRDSAPTQEVAPAASEERPFLSRIRGLFGKKDAAIETTPAPTMTAEPPVEEKKGGFRLFQRMPQGSAKETAPTTTIEPAQPIQAIPVSNPQPLPAAPVKIVTPTNYQTSSTIALPSASVAISSPVAVNVNNVVPTTSSRPNKISPDLVSKVGHAEDYSWITGQIRIENGVHTLYYATPEVVDRFHGTVILTSEKDLRSIPEGAHVCVRGSVAQQSGGLTTYRVQALDVLTAQAGAR